MIQLPTLTIGGVELNPKKIQHQYEQWLTSQHPAVEVAVTTVMSTLQGAFIGYLMGSMGNVDPTAGNPGANPALSAQFKAMQSGGPIAQARNMAALTGVNSGLGLAIRKARKGKDDVFTTMGASFGAGVAYSLLSGAANPLQSAISTGIAFAAFNGLFYKVGQMFKPQHTDTDYERGKYMLKTLGLTKYGDNLKRALLTDNTIMLWNDGALAEARIPAGPRLLILHHLDSYRSPSAVLKPALPIPMLPGAAAAGAS